MPRESCYISALNGIPEVPAMGISDRRHHHVCIDDLHYLSAAKIERTLLLNPYSITPVIAQ